MKVSKIALGVALALGGFSVVATAPAIAQKKKAKEAETTNAQGRKFDLSKEERTAIAALQTAVESGDMAAAGAALAAAQAASKGTDARYLTASMQLRMAIASKDVAAQAAAIDAMLASGGVTAADLPALYRNQAALASNAGDRKKAEAALTKLVELAPNDDAAVVSLAEVKNSLGKGNEAIALIDRAIELKKAAGPVPENWYKRGLKLAYDGKMVPQSLKFSRALVAAYPTKQNWRDAILIYRDLANPDKMTELDALRLLRAAQALSGERDYFELADTLNDGGLPGESSAVLKEGVAAKMVDGNKGIFKELMTLTGGKVSSDRAALAGLEKQAASAANGKVALSTADAYYGYGDYAKAAALYRTAIQKGSVDTNLANSRLGMALALAGQKAEAEAAFKAVTGPRAELAAFWMLWLSQRG